MIQNNTDELNKLIAKSIIISKDRMAIGLQSVNNILLSIVSSKDYENNRLNIIAREKLNTNIVNINAQDLINEVNI